MLIRSWMIVLVGVICIGAAALTTTGAQQPPAPSESLSYIPSQSLFFVHLEGKALWNSPLIDQLQKRVPPEKWKKFEEAFTKDSEKITGIVRQNFRSATFVIDSWEIPQVPSFAFMFTSSIPIDRSKFITGVQSYFSSKIKEQPSGDAITHQGVELTSVVMLPGQMLYAGLLQGNIAAIGEVEALKKLINQRKQGGAGPMSVAIKAAAGHDVALGIHLPEPFRNQLDALIQMGMGAAGDEQRRDYLTTKLGFDIFKALLDMKVVHLQLDLQKDILLRLMIEANTEKGAVRFQRMLDMAALMGEFGLGYLQTMSQMKSYQELREFGKFFTLLGEAASDSKVTRNGTTVELSLHAPLAGPELMTAASAVFTRLVLLQDRMNRQANLRMLAIAMHNYHNDYDKLPSPGYYSAGGNSFLAAPKAGGKNTPNLSWRVAILPYIEADNIFKQFHYDEPWDSEHNKKLIPLMPKIFQCPGAPNPGEGKTYLQVFVSPEKPADPAKQKFRPIFQLGKPGISLGQLTVQDGTSNTIMIAESAKAVIWTKPDDMLIEDDEKPLPKLGCIPDEDDFLVVFGDGSVRAIRRALSDMKQHEQLLRQMIGRQDGRNDEVGPIIK